MYKVFVEVETTKEARKVIEEFGDIVDCEVQITVNGVVAASKEVEQCEVKGNGIIVNKNGVKVVNVGIGNANMIIKLLDDLDILVNEISNFKLDVEVNSAVF